MKKEIDALNRCCSALGNFKMGDFVQSVLNQAGPVQIKGVWWYVNPAAGTAAGDGTTAAYPFAGLDQAYAAAAEGDGIIVFSTSDSAALTTTYLKKPLLWTKNDITVVGVCAPSRMYKRSRIANKDVVSTSSALSETAHGIVRADAGGSFIADGWIVGMTGTIADAGSNSGASFTVTAVTATVLTVAETLTVQAAISSVLTSYIADLIVVSGSNNSFVNIHVGNYGVNAKSAGCVFVTGARNYFFGCHFEGAGNATPAATTSAHDLELSGAQENTFEKCAFGSDTIVRAAANGNIVFDTGSGGCLRNQFYDCDIISYSATSGKGAILSTGATSASGVQIFSRCRFINWEPNGEANVCASAFIGTKFTSGSLLFDSCALLGWAAWDSVSGDKVAWVANSAAVASGAGGIASAP